jgi:RNA polymerase-binding transcription factor DksA
LSIFNLPDDLDVASEMEAMDRNNAINSILNNMYHNNNIELLLDNTKTCISCSCIIPIERQRVILSIKKTCDYCAECQDYIEKSDRMYN